MKSETIEQKPLIPYHGPHMGQYQNLDDGIGWMLLGLWRMVEAGGLETIILNFVRKLLDIPLDLSKALGLDPIKNFKMNIAVYYLW
jgi:hypothetical protein